MSEFLTSVVSEVQNQTPYESQKRQHIYPVHPPRPETISRSDAAEL